MNRVGLEPWDGGPRIGLDGDPTSRFHADAMTPPPLPPGEDSRHELGLDGEALAESYLSRRGLRPVARRFATPVGELDLVMREGATLVFVEVKTRRDRRWGEPQDAVSPEKQRRLTRAARWFVHHRGQHDVPLRFDVVGVVIAPGAAPAIEHFRDAFPPADE